jgi:hypothetical protein
VPKHNPLFYKELYIKVRYVYKKQGDMVEKIIKIVIYAITAKS